MTVPVENASIQQNPLEVQLKSIPPKVKLHIQLPYMQYITHYISVPNCTFIRNMKESGNN